MSICQLCGKETNELFHFGEMCRECYEDWCLSYYITWGIIKPKI